MSYDATVTVHQLPDLLLASHAQAHANRAPGIKTFTGMARFRQRCLPKSLQQPAFLCAGSFVLRSPVRRYSSHLLSVLRFCPLNSPAPNATSTTYTFSPYASCDAVQQYFELTASTFLSLNPVRPVHLLAWSPQPLALLHHAPLLVPASASSPQWRLHFSPHFPTRGFH